MKFDKQDIIDSLEWENNFEDLYPGFSSEIEEDGDYMFQSKEYFYLKDEDQWTDYIPISEAEDYRYVDDIINIFNSFPEEFPIYRSIRVKSKDDIRWEDLGESWSFDFESAKQFGRHNGSNIILSAIVNEDNVDWMESMKRYSIFSGHEEEDDEHEIVVIDTTELKDVKATPFKEAKEIGKNPIFTRVPNVKSFESWLHNIIYKDMKSFEEVLFEPRHIKRFSEISMSKGEIKNKFGDLIKQLQELVLHLFDKNQTPEIDCKITSVHNDENDEWVDGIELPDGEFSKLNLTDLSELFKQKKKILPCKMKFTDDKGKRTKEPIINGYIKFYHPKLDKQNEPDMPWENKSEGVILKDDEFIFNFKTDTENDIIHLSYKSSLLKQGTFHGNKIIYGCQIIKKNDKDEFSFLRSLKDINNAEAHISPEDYELLLNKIINKFSYEHPIGEYDIIISPASKSRLLYDIVKKLKAKDMNVLLANDSIIKNTIEGIKIDYEKYKSTVPTKWNIKDELDKQFQRATKEGDFKMKRVSPRFRKFFTNFLIFKNDNQRRIFNAIRNGKVLVVEDYITSGTTLKEMLRLIDELTPQDLNIFVFIKNIV